MGLLNEPAPSQFTALLKAGLQQLSLNQSVPFQQYTKVVLAQDGYVFWVASGAPTAFVGSLHVATDRVQEEDQTIGVNNFVFSSESEITQFNEIDSQTMWVGTWAIGQTTLQIAFSKRGPYYQAADLWHYSGIAVYPALSSQLINSASDLPTEPIVSNSLPIWLTQTTVGTETVPVYPSFLVPENVVPPYIVAHINPDDTVALGSFPIKGWPGTEVPDSGTAPLYDLPSSQLYRDTVKLTLYGLNNQQAIQYYFGLIDYSLNTDAFGFCNDPVIRDEKRTQTEIRAIAMKKTLTIEASYYSSTTDAIARRLILSSLITNITVS